MIFLVITAEGGSASATLRVRVPLLLDDAANRFRHFVELLDVAVGDPAAFQGFDGAAFQDQLAAGLAAELDQLDAGRTDVQAEQGSVLTTKQ
jgi:hypothetical protein